MPPRGSIPEEDWQYLLEALDEINFDGDAVLEIIPSSPSQIAQETRRFLGQLVAA
jgi:sugar phosphate isomerase/epimerase